jgi:hypothetical protein
MKSKRPIDDCFLMEWIAKPNRRCAHPVAL